MSRTPRSRARTPFQGLDQDQSHHSQDFDLIFDLPAIRCLVIINLLIIVICDSLSHLSLQVSHHMLLAAAYNHFWRKLHTQKHREAVAVDHAPLRLHPCSLPSITVPLGREKEREMRHEREGKGRKGRQRETKEGVTMSVFFLELCLS